ncbi:hypothetical protein SDC9_105724 [bioreactor metagenome]|uniref:Uncharacterized protein n=1 Tax=bioreactor metagenome TaxID=1076179 RepID=A0A645B2V4_9ZZZZ
MRQEGHVFEVNRPILAVEQERISIECIHRNRVHTLSILQYRFPCPSSLPFFTTIDIVFALLLVRDVECIDHECIREFLAQLHRLEPADIRLPPFSTEDIPELSLRYVSDDTAVIIRIEPAVSDVRAEIARVGFRL